MKIPSRENLESLLEEALRGPISPDRLTWIPALIDHTSLKIDVTEAQLKVLCEEAKVHKFGAVCVRAEHVKYCVAALHGASVNVVSVVGFPTGKESTREKVEETKLALQAGAREIDMVLNVSAVKERRLRDAFLDIRGVVDAACDVPVKVILETCLLSRDEILLAASLAKAAGAAFLKTSTGFSTGGATVEDIALLRSVAAEDMSVKASGGVRSLEDALRMVIAGANRIGTSSGVAIASGKYSQAKQSGVY